MMYDGTDGNAVDLPASVDAESVQFSVVIGSYNGASKLPAALGALAAQTTSASFEVIVVDDASKDRTSEVAAGFGAKVIRLNDNRGHGHTLNVGLAAARGHFMAMMDDDCVPPPTWIQGLADAWASVDKTVTMIGGVVEPMATDTFNRRYVQVRRPLSHQEATVNERSGVLERLRHAFLPPRQALSRRAVFYTIGANSSVRVDEAREVGGFKDTPGAGEEESIARKLRARFGDQTVQLFPEIVMYHDFDRSVRDSLRRGLGYGRAHGRDWHAKGGIPTLSPIPVVVVAIAAVFSLWSVAAGVVALVALPPMLYRRWIGGVSEIRRPEVAAYPYVQATEDLVGDVGFVQGWVRARLGGTATPRGED